MVFDFVSFICLEERRKKKKCLRVELGFGVLGERKMILMDKVFLEICDIFIPLFKGLLT